MARKRLTKKLRFEVFKRDAFTCQYCGRMAPDVVLEVDHINPIANGGDNELMNLITSCFDCNRGKGKRTLSNKDEVKKQQEQLKQINENREQLKMMIEWKKELSALEEEQIDALEDLIDEYNQTFTDVGRSKFSKWIKKYGFNEVYETFETSLIQYVDINDINKSIGKAIDYVPRIINSKKKLEKDPLLKEIYYIRGILRNRGMIYNEGTVWDLLKSTCTNEESCEEIKEMAKTARHWTEFRTWVENVYL